MRQHIGNDPVVVVHNYLESFRPFLSRTGDDNILLDRRFNGDQALYWLGDEKLVITSAPIRDFNTLAERWGYQNTTALSPQEMTPSLSEDILREEHLLEAIIAYAGEKKQIALIPYAATKEFYRLAEALQHSHGLKVALPESPTKNHLWVKDYLGTKVGFRTMFSQWSQGANGHKCPEGFVCEELPGVAEMVIWFREQEKGCVIKASQGGSGVGNLFLAHQEIPATPDAVIEHIKDNIYLHHDLFVVEEYIESPSEESPSAEFFIPPAGSGLPFMTYLCEQHFESSGRFAGVLIGPELKTKAYYPKYTETAMYIAHKMQKMGYVGYFDMDSVVDGEDDVYMVEINTRRTGGTYAHEFMEYKFGSSYYDRFSVLAHNKMAAGNCRTLQDLETTFADLLYPLNGQEKGLILLLTSTLPVKGTFGFLILGKTLKETKHIRAQMTARLKTG